MSAAFATPLPLGSEYGEGKEGCVSSDEERSVEAPESRAQMVCGKVRRLSNEPESGNRRPTCTPAGDQVLLCQLNASGVRHSSAARERVPYGEGNV